MANMGADMPDGLPYRPWLVPIVEERTVNRAIDDPHIRCLPDNFLRAYGLPHMLKFVHTDDLLVVLNEMNAGYRQVFLDARELPEEPTPSWQGTRRVRGPATLWSSKPSGFATIPGSTGTAVS